jgi:hypothetical protein
MADYYRFVNRIVDIRATDKTEQVMITDAPDKQLRIVINKSSGNNKAGRPFMDFTYDPAITKEIRLYLQGGNDRVTINNFSSPIKVRIIDSAGIKTVDVQQTNTPIKLYGQKDSLRLVGNAKRIRFNLSGDTLQTKFIPVNLYNVWMPLATGNINADDGFLLGLGFRYTGNGGFHTEPYTTVQQVMISHSFATEAFKVRYSGQFIRAVGKADLVTEALIQAPDNTMNFFGRGNQTILDKTGDYHLYYRTRFDLYELDLALRWPVGKGSTFSAGPSFQFYHADLNGNDGRFITQTNKINAYDAQTINQDKAHLGLQLMYESNRRDNHTLPGKGYYLKVNIQAYGGLNSYSRSYAQICPEFTIYQKIDPKAHLVLSDRVGGGVSLGNPAFYQSMFLGGQGNLLGFLQNRFAGDHMVYNNLQARLKLANIAGYILPGQLGLSGFYDIGRVWVNGEHSDQWHQGTGGGLYFSPAGLTVLQVLAGHSDEGWYPYISLNFRI